MSQDRPDAVWPIGNKNEYPLGTDSFGVLFFNFKDGIKDEFYIKKYISQLFSVTSISRNNKLLLYSNGIHVYNNNLEIMENGNDINPGELQKNYYDSGYPAVNAIFSLFSPGNESKHIDLIHMQAEFNYGIYKECNGSFLYHTKIDLTSNNGLGKVIFKNKIIGRGPFKKGGMAACRHANGRDWWFAVNRCSDSLAVYLLDQNGPKFHHYDSIIRHFSNAPSQAVFSPDGRYFALHSNTQTESEIHLFDFDRCTGRFSNHRLWNYIDLPHLPTAGVAFSPNSRFMYIISREKIHQYNLEAADIRASDQVVAEYDGHLDPFAPTVFFMAQLAPDGKIYINGRGSLHSLTVINQPDLPGILCDVRQHAVPLFFQNDFSMPYFPCFTLGPETGSVCDSLIVSNEDLAEALQVQLYPVPASDQLHLDCPSGDIERVDMIDLNGTIVKHFFGNTRELDIRDIRQGVYLLRCYGSKSNAVLKVVIQR
ncbi:MAG TPA: T9SS type A sorting domain-containing protein [Saprospiraceae bacterium]|nr:T9SS type A sorting domain-containing protein [Saprospiraceae bacterium]